jgi:hypothetical protein
MEPCKPTSLYTNSRIYIGFAPEAEELNWRILNAYRALGDQDLLRRTHFFGGRYENLYLERTRIPEIDRVLAFAEDFARQILRRPAQALRCGFWLNDMGPGHVTTEHTHEEDDELLSGVYYVQVPPSSGELLILDRRMRTLVQPEAGMFVFFAPGVLHAVSENRSAETRLSIGMNFGPEPD